MKTILMILAALLISLMASAQDVIENVAGPRFSPYGITVKADGLSQRQGSVVVLAGLENPARRRKDVTLRCSLYDSYGRLVAQGATDLTIRAFRRVKAGQRVMLDAPLLWSVSDPALYTLRVELAETGAKEPSDSRQTTIGLCQATMAGPAHISLNGDMIPLRGLSVDPAITPERFRRLLRVMRKAGMNAVEAIGAGEPLASVADREGIMLLDTAATDARHPSRIRIDAPVGLPADDIIDPAGFPTPRYYELSRKYGGDTDFARTTPAPKGSVASALRVIAEDQRISASDFRPAYVAIMALDQAGNLCADDSRNVDADIDGLNRQIPLVGGRALVMVTGLGHRKTVRVTASTPGLPPATATVRLQ